MAVIIAFFFIIDPKRVVRDDGTHIAIFKQATVMEELKALALLFTNLKIIALIPGILVAEMNLVCYSDNEPLRDDLLTKNRHYLLASTHTTLTFALDL
jgi:hypothetical protein